MVHRKPEDMKIYTSGAGQTKGILWGNPNN